MVKKEELIDWIMKQPEGKPVDMFQCNGRKLGENKYCCLGVGCKVFNIKEKAFNFQVLVFGDEGEEHFAPKELIDKLDLFDKWGCNKWDETTKRLSQLNDNGTSFVNIAKLIRSNPSAYFRGPK